MFEELLGQTITRVSIEPWSVRLLLGTNELHIEGIWRLTTPEGAVVDQSQEFGVRDGFELWRLAGGQVQDFHFDDHPLPRFVMSVAGQWGLEVVASENGEEDWGLTTSRGGWVICNGAKIAVFPPTPQ
jgi:hypothetical protein